MTASLARGTTLIRDAAELRVKETDRIKALAEELSKAGVTVEELPDGLSITGPARFHAAHLDSRCDHRIAMSLLVLAAWQMHHYRREYRLCIDFVSRL